LNEIRAVGFTIQQSTIKKSTMVPEWLVEMHLGKAPPRIATQHWL
jgi:hypothetical protein